MYEAIFLNAGFITTFQEKFYATFIQDSRYLFFVKGLGNTLLISLLATILGTIIGIVLSLMNLSKNKFLQKTAKIYIDVIRGTPALTQLMIIYYLILNKSSLSPLIIGSIGFGINSGAYVAEIIRAGIQSVSKGQEEAGRSLGLTKKQTMIYIIMPQAVKNIIPALTNEFVVLIKETAVIASFPVMDLTKAALSIQGMTFDFVFPLIAVAIAYYCITKTLSTLFGRLEKHLRQGD